MNDFEAVRPERSDLLDILNAQAKSEKISVEQEQAVDSAQAITLSEQQAIAEGKENQSGLLPETRRALVALLRNGVIMAANKRLLFESLCRDQIRIQAHLADMYLRMLLDEQDGLAILLQQGEEEIDDNEEISTLITRRTLTLFDSLLLLVLRKHYQQREAAGEQRVVIDVDRIEVAMQPFLPLSNSSRSGRRRLNGSLSNMKDRRILAAVRGEDDRYEITPVIRHVVNAACLEQMLDEYRALAGQAAATAEEDDNEHI